MRVLLESVRGNEPGHSGPVPAEARRLPVKRDDAAIVAGLVDGQGWAKAAVFDKYAADVRRVLGHVVGADSELPDLIHDVFVGVLEGIGGVRRPDQLRSWIVTIAVRTGRERIRRRQRRRWLTFFAPNDVPEVLVEADDPAFREAVLAMYGILDRLNTDDRLAFTLRRLSGLELGEIADACGVSLATVKRRLARAECRFLELAGCDPNLQDWVKGGASWRP